jgi:hypothetical protein
VEESALPVFLEDLNSNFAREEGYEILARRPSPSGRTGGAFLATGSFIGHWNVAGGVQWYLGREIVHFSKRPFSKSVEMVDFIAEPRVLRTPKRIRTLITPASHVS